MEKFTIILMVAQAFIQTNAQQIEPEMVPGKAGLFLPGIVSTEYEDQMCGALSEGGDRFYFCRRNMDAWQIVSVSRAGDGWTQPAPVFKPTSFTDRDFTLSPDGLQMYLGSNRPREGEEDANHLLDIFVSDLLPGGSWSEPRGIGKPVNSEANENYPCVAGNGNLYFFSKRRGGVGLSDIYRSEYKEGAYLPPVCLDSSVNSRKNDWDAFIAPDESYIIFSSQDRDDAPGDQDLYISFRREDGTWTQARNMGPKVNSPLDEICPGVYSGHLFFTSRRRGFADVYRIDAGIIDELREH